MVDQSLLDRHLNAVAGDASSISDEYRKKHPTVTRYTVTQPVSDMPAVRSALSVDPRDCYATPEDANRWLINLMRANSFKRLDEHFTLPFAVCPIQCWEGSGQAVGCTVPAASALPAPDAAAWTDTVRRYAVTYPSYEGVRSLLPGRSDETFATFAEATEALVVTMRSPRPAWLGSDEHPLLVCEVDCWPDTLRPTHPLIPQARAFSAPSSLLWLLPKADETDEAEADAPAMR